MDPRIKQLAKNLINYSCRLQTGEHILITYEGSAVRPLAQQLVREAYAAGGYEARSSPFRPHVAGKIVEGGKALLDALR